MPITRKFLDWRSAALPAVVEYLAAAYPASSGTWDLDRVVLVLPGSRAKRRLLELVVEAAEVRHLRLLPPLLETVGRLPELLYESKRPFAGDLAQKLAWVSALKDIERSRLACLMARPPADERWAQWQLLADHFWGLHRELAADGLDFADVARQTEKGASRAEADRWRLLAEVQARYLAKLDELELWDVQTARLYAVKHQECRTDRDIVLVATADMNGTLRAMLQQVAPRVTALVHAADACADRFDEYGCVDPQAWQGVHLDIPEERWCVAADPAEQAELVARQLARFEGRYRADEIAIGVPDPELVPHLTRQLSQCGVATRWVAGRPLTESGPWRLLAAVADFVSDRRSDAFAALVRHPDVEEWLLRSGVAEGWLTELDEYLAEHLPPRLDDWLGSRERRGQIEAAWSLIDRLLARLSARARPLPEWPAAMAAMLGEIYGHLDGQDEDDATRETLSACRDIREALAEQQEIPPSVAPEVEAVEAIRILGEQLAGQSIASPPEPQAVEMLGWLELPLDESPALIVTSFNEGFVPTSLNADHFLPNRLRLDLGLTDNARRYARDAYALSVLLASRPDLTLLVGRRDLRGAPLIPSRLLFAADENTITRRVQAIVSRDGEGSTKSGGAAERPLAGTLSAGCARSAFHVRRPQLPLPRPIERLRVTAFRDYLACPYRFYLRHVLGIAPVDDRAVELSPPQFGNLVHEVLCEFGRSELRGATDAKTIGAFLEEKLDSLARRQFGRRRLPAVNVQLGQLRRRLTALADWQASWAAQGWRIEHVEVPERNARVPFEVDGHTLQLSGRIDRIDRHEATGEWFILDYKTGESADPPEKTHRKDGEWIDLQLPLYRRLCAPLGIAGQIRLGYVAISKKLADVGLCEAEWDAADLKSADEMASTVVRRILAGEFWPPNDEPPAFDDFAALCQSGVFGRQLEQELAEAAR